MNRITQYFNMKKTAKATLADYTYVLLDIYRRTQKEGFCPLPSGKSAFCKEKSINNRFLEAALATGLISYSKSGKSKRIKWLPATTPSEKDAQKVADWLADYSRKYLQRKEEKKKEAKVVVQPELFNNPPATKEAIIEVNSRESMWECIEKNFTQTNCILEKISVIEKAISMVLKQQNAKSNN